METDEAKAKTRDWFERVWNQLDRSAVGEMMHDEAEVMGLGPTAVGPSGFLEVHKRFSAAYGQIHVSIVDLVGERNEVAGHGRFSAVHLASQTEVDFLFSFAGEFSDGKLIWVRNVVDYTSLMGQLNLLDPKRFDLIFEAP
ncbi:MAG: nuclear transport factor 2 family protein [Verrucomicrobiota bacterium]